jgi:hypothetical protein
LTVAMESGDLGDHVAGDGPRWRTAANTAAVAASGICSAGATMWWGPQRMRAAARAGL